MPDRKGWSDLSQTQQRLAVVAGAVEAVVTSAALADLRRRPAESVRGPKVAWLLAFVVQPVGPLLYFIVGRR
jgi:Phospholipase_D-nuclease N-terminal